MGEGRTNENPSLFLTNRTVRTRKSARTMDEISLDNAAIETEEVVEEIAALVATDLATGLSKLFEEYEKDSRTLSSLGEWVGIALTPVTSHRDSEALQAHAWNSVSRPSVIRVLERLTDRAAEAGEVITLEPAEVRQLALNAVSEGDLLRRIGLPKSYDEFVPAAIADSIEALVAGEQEFSRYLNPTWLLRNGTVFKAIFERPTPNRAGMLHIIPWPADEVRE